MTKRRISPAEMLSRLQGKGISHKSLEEAAPGMTAKRGVKAAFELSWEALKDNPETQELAYILSLFAGAPIPWDLVVQMQPETDKEDLEDWLVVLEDLHLVKCVDETKASYQQHQLIREFLHLKETEFTSQQWQKKFCQVMVEVAREMPYTLTLKNINTLQDSIPHLAEAVTTWQNFLAQEQLVWAFTGLVWFNKGKIDYQQSEYWCNKFLSAMRHILGEENSDFAHSLNNLAEIYRHQGRYKEAEPLYLRALEITKCLLGEENPSVATSLNNLALLYYSQGRYKEAEPLFLQALEITKCLLGEENSYVATSLNNLALLYHSQGRYKEAEVLYLQALDMRKRLLVESHPDVAQSLNNLALLYYSQCRYKEAEVLYLQALNMRKRLLVESHPDVAQSLNNLALLYYSQCRYKEAEVLYLQALEIAQKRLGDNHPHTIKYRKNLQKLRNKL